MTLTTPATGRPDQPSRRRPKMAPLTGVARSLLHPDAHTTAAQLADDIHRHHPASAAVAGAAVQLDATATTREVSTTEAARLLGCHRSTVLRRARSGRIRARRHGWFWRITVDVAGGLTELAARVLQFAAYRLPELPRDGREYNVVQQELGITMTRFAQVLSHTLDNPQALAYDGPAVMRLRREAEARAARRGLSRRRLGAQ